MNDWVAADEMFTRYFKTCHDIDIQGYTTLVATCGDGKKDHRTSIDLSVYHKRIAFREWFY